ncbi:MAG TPA: thiamine pyrophosphate-dependent enzyme [Candidatus Krumholzibacteria bacterium]|nr:thiamine pyrophosphate-dependent enzyme [Candidatus Krumholzibacteria bacterium]HPD70955.1 thiamine pyrophosphate-dependent enzyme [Candidatus Krumholzibacteria bacterium]HRY39345.1 thiamine pyrophosphate-dependent enzyme [Candidatus Krumholzibacteria bacterium]
MSDTALKVADYKSDLKPIWCAGCGDYGVITPFYQALVEVQAVPKDTVIVSGIGCSGRFPYFCNTFGFHGVHGRAVPTAAGVKLARPELTVIAVGGDGDGLGIGGGHVPHVARKNVDLTYILIDNSIYGLTKGQSSPTSPLSMKSKTAPYAYVEEPLNPLQMFLAYNASFVARGYSGKPKDLKDLFVQAIRHRGFSVLHIFSPCVSMNKEITFKTMNEIVKPLPDDWDPTNKLAAFEKAMDTGTFWTGLVYREERETIHDRLDAIGERVGRYQDLTELLKRFR